MEAIPRSNTMVANESSSQMTISDAKNVVSNKTRKRPEKKKGRRFGVSRSGSLIQEIVSCKAYPCMLFI